MPWRFGNLHCHSDRSDGHDGPAVVVRAYRDLGFQFVGITDHNRRTGPEDCGEALPDFTVLGACEYSAEAEGRPVHVNGIGCTATVAGGAAEGTVAQALQRGVDGFLAQGAFTVLNHPNWRWSFGLGDLLPVRGAHAIELWNGAYDSDNLGDAGHASTESLWDAALSAGMRLWAVASDDCHRVSAGRAFGADPPGHAWVAVDAPDDRAGSLVQALIDGRFYASNGVRLPRVSLTPSAVEIEAQVRGSVCRIHVIGAGGRELLVVDGCSARYSPRRDDGYIRCRVEDGMGRCAWTQPLFLD